jgi:7-cyano-7-deazaguanine reductase
MKHEDIVTHPSPYSGEYSGAVRIDVNDFTHLAGQADPWFANVQIEYVPREKTLDVDSVATYMAGWRDTDTTPEDAVKKICEELSQAGVPMMMTVVAAYRQRNGASVNCQAKYIHPDAKQPQQRIVAPH